MFESFLINSVIGGFGVAAIAGILGSFVLWKNMTYFGDALSHSALLGITFGILLNINLPCAVAIIALTFALSFSYNNFKYSSDTTLGILSYSSISFAIILGTLNHLKMDLMGYLFGDILAITTLDIYYLITYVTIGLTWMYFNWNKMILYCISEEILQSEGADVKSIKLNFTIILALFIAVSFKIVGIFLITALLILPPAVALPLSRTPLQMISGSIIIGSISILGGVYLASNHNFPTGPAVIIISLGCFGLTNLLRFIRS